MYEYLLRIGAKIKSLAFDSTGGKFLLRFRVGPRIIPQVVSSEIKVFTTFPDDLINRYLLFSCLNSLCWLASFTKAILWFMSVVKLIKYAYLYTDKELLLVALLARISHRQSYKLNCDCKILLFFWYNQ